MTEIKSDALYKWMALFVIVIGTFMSVLDSTIVNIAIPKLMAVFGVSLDEIKWVLTVYTLTLAAIIPLTGYLGNVLGSRILYVAALIAFTVGSFLCGFAWSNTSMIIFRIIQALGGGMLMPVGMTILLEAFEPKERGMAFGFYGIAIMAAPAMGPTLGGYIIERLDWRLIFYVNVPIGIVAVILAILILKSSERKKISDFDYLGVISSVVGMVSILYVLGEGSTVDWGDVKNPFLMALGCFSILVFIVNELTHRNPILDLKVLKIFNFTMSQIITVVLSFVLMGGMYVIPIFLQNLRGFTAMETGIILLPSAIATGISMPISGKLFDKFGLKSVVIPGLIILAIPSYLLSFVNLSTSKESIAMLLTIRGIGMGLAMMPLNTAGLNVVPRHLAGSASALTNTIRQLGGAFAVTIMTTLLNSQLHAQYSKMAEQITLFNPAAVDMLGKLRGLLMKSGLSNANANGGAVYQIYGYVYQQAYIESMDYALAVAAVASVAAILGVLFMREKKDHQEESHLEGGEEVHAVLLE